MCFPSEWLCVACVPAVFVLARVDFFSLRVHMGVSSGLDPGGEVYRAQNSILL